MSTKHRDRAVFIFRGESAHVFRALAHAEIDSPDDSPCYFAAPSGSGKSYACERYPHLFQDVDQIDSIRALYAAGEERFGRATDTGRFHNSWWTAPGAQQWFDQQAAAALEEHFKTGGARRVVLGAHRLYLPTLGFSYVRWVLVPSPQRLTELQSKKDPGRGQPSLDEGQNLKGVAQWLTWWSQFATEADLAFLMPTLGDWGVE